MNANHYEQQKIRKARDEYRFGDTCRPPTARVFAHLAWTKLDDVSVLWVDEEDGGWRLEKVRRRGNEDTL